MRRPSPPQRPRKGVNVGQVLLADVHAHGALRRLVNGARRGLGVVVARRQQLLQRGHRLLAQRGAVAHGLRHARVDKVVLDDARQLGEVPAVPLAHAHGKRVQVLVQRVHQRNRLPKKKEGKKRRRGACGENGVCEGAFLAAAASRGAHLNDHVVRAVDVELDLGARVRVREAQRRARARAALERRQKVLNVQPHAAQQLGHAAGGNAKKRREVGGGGAVRRGAAAAAVPAAARTCPRRGTGCRSPPGWPSPGAGRPRPATTSASWSTTAEAGGAGREHAKGRGAARRGVGRAAGLGLGARARSRGARSPPAAPCATPAASAPKTSSGRATARLRRRR